MPALYLKTIFIAGLLLPAVICGRAYGQGEDNTWIFGINAGLNFNGGSPVPVFSNMYTHYASASVSDVNGRLLFYTDGIWVWNRNHRLMPNGFSLNPVPYIYSYNITQGALIIPFPDVPDKYYVFSLVGNNIGGGVDRSTNRLYYSVVDMTGDGGLGDVDPGQKGILLDTTLKERMTAVVGENCNVWLLVQSRISAVSIRAYEITAAGINTTPVISGYFSSRTSNLDFGSMAAAPNRKKIAVTLNGPNGLWCSFGQEVVGMVLDFDPTTGVCSNPVWLETDRSLCDIGGKGIAFSPDNSKVYVVSDIKATAGHSRVYQYDLSSGNQSIISLSQINILSPHPSRHLRLAPDGKIYIGRPGGPTVRGQLKVIDQPNLPATSFGFSLSDIYLLNGSYLGGGGLPNVVPVIRRDTVRHAYQVFNCFHPHPVRLTASDTSGRDYRWYDGSGNTFMEVNTPGIYSVEYNMPGCRYYVDTFILRYIPLPEITTAPHCTGKPGGAFIRNAPGDTTTYTYTWLDVTGARLKSRTSQTGDSITGLDGGTYSVRIIAGECDTTLSFTIEALPPPDASFTADSIVCKGVPLAFENAAPAVRYQWDFGDGHMADTADPVHTYDTPGNYTVTFTAEDVEGCRNTTAKMIEVRSFSLGLDASAEIVDAGTVVELYTRAGDPYMITAWRPEYLFHNQTVRDQSIRADSTRQYIVTGYDEAYGCPDTAVVTVSVRSVVQLPTAFTPDGDGRNDRFRPVIVQQKGVVIRYLQVYDRWGKLIWEARGTDALWGWDGTYAGTPAQVGVYFYTAEIDIPGRPPELRKGEVTLVR